MPEQCVVSSGRHGCPRQQVKIAIPYLISVILPSACTRQLRQCSPALPQPSQARILRTLPPRRLRQTGGSRTAHVLLPRLCCSLTQQLQLDAPTAVPCSDCRSISRPWCCRRHMQYLCQQLQAVQSRFQCQGLEPVVAPASSRRLRIGHPAQGGYSSTAGVMLSKKIATPAGGRCTHAATCGSTGIEC